MENKRWGAFFFLLLKYKKMSSVQSAYSQVAPFKRYVADAGTTGLIYDSAGSNGITVAAHTVLRDMGKTVHLANGNTLRKVQILPNTDSNTVNLGRTGYIYIGEGLVPAGQNITALN
jgi:hypothetical protein